MILKDRIEFLDPPKDEDILIFGQEPERDAMNQKLTMARSPFKGRVNDIELDGPFSSPMI